MDVEAGVSDAGGLEFKIMYNWRFTETPYNLVDPKRSCCFLLRHCLCFGGGAAPNPGSFDRFRCP